MGQGSRIRLDRVPRRIGLSRRGSGPSLATLRHGLPHGPAWQSEPLRRITSAYLVEDIGDLLITDIAKQKIGGHQFGYGRVLLALLVRTRVAWVALGQPPQVA